MHPRRFLIALLVLGAAGSIWAFLPSSGTNSTSPASESSDRVEPNPVEAESARSFRGSINGAERETLIERAAGIQTLQSYLVAHRGERIVEEYYRGGAEGEAHNVKSAAKSIISLLVGIAIEEGHLSGVDQPIGPYFESYFAANPDSAKAWITLRDLLTMRSGLETTSFHNYGEWVTSPDWVAYALDQPMVDAPGDDMEYSTGTTHLLSVILTRATGMSTRAFAEKHLFGPMGIELGGWDRDPDGYYMGGNNMALTPEGMLAVGIMVLNEGRYEGRQIVPEEYLREAFRTYTRSNYNPYDYGYLWWKRPVGGQEVRFAWGYGGQYIFVVPDRDLVVAVTSSIRDEREHYKRAIFGLLERTIQYAGT